MKNSSAAESLCHRTELIPPLEREAIHTRPDTQSHKDTLMGRILLRIALCKEYGISPVDTAIIIAAEGKPYLRDHENVYFSISHTDSCVACAVGDIPLGLDVQTVTDKDHTRVATRLFTEGERDHILDDPMRFYEIWTRKESLGKLTGRGITHDLKGVDVLTGENVGGVVFVPITIAGCAAALCLSREDSVKICEITETEV